MLLFFFVSSQLHISYRRACISWDSGIRIQTGLAVITSNIAWNAIFLCMLSRQRKKPDNLLWVLCRLRYQCLEDGFSGAKEI